ncbi:hypothetical protein Acsp04_02050 [Actinomadura sp. NBRC 104425]|uniref:hypothetical protein n=1 Tax=Actinomadura sp. NBRC 104425 TaxID=3032204 RepID=UPI0024A1D0D4|nr:hypothetical protein [Actinomadura sp. NBRC 104425]GLZ09970.1 hypothetical protein Acsp04_02050 [Actinomadura sp. NBRC 104425]
MHRQRADDGGHARHDLDLLRPPGPPAPRPAGRVGGATARLPNRVIDCALAEPRNQWRIQNWLRQGGNGDPRPTLAG